MADEIFAGLDVGSHVIRIAVGKVVPTTDSKDQMHIIGALEVPSSGVNKGSVTDVEEAVSCISLALEQAERMTGVPITSVWVGISGHHIVAQESRGVIGVARSDGEIREEDVERAMEAARTVATPTNHEIIHVIPKSFTVDNQRGIKDPVGMTGIRLEVDALIIQGLISQIKTLTKCIYRTGLDIEDLVFSVLAASESTVTSRQKELGVVVVNIGASTTSMVVYEEGDVLHTSVLPVGSDHITSDIAIGLRTSIDIAEQVKQRFATCLPDTVSPDEEIDLYDVGAPESERVGRRFIADIAEARAHELFEMIDKELKRIGRSGMLPAGLVLTGGAMKLEGMVELAKRVLKLPATQGSAIGVSSVIDRASDPAFAPAIGLVLWGRHSRGGGNGGKFGKFLSPLKGVGSGLLSGLSKLFRSGKS